MTTEDTAGISFWISSGCLAAYEFACVLHRYHVVRCPCGKETVASPAKGLVSAVDGRKRDLRPERGEPRGAGAGHFHRRFVGALPAVARQDRGASRDMARRTVVGGQHRPLHSRS